MFGRRLFSGALAMVALLALSPAASRAATVLGSPLTLSFGGGTGRVNNTFVQTHLTEASAQLTSPVNGTVVRWSLRGTNTNGEPNALQLRVLEPASGGKFVGLATSAEVTTPNSGNDDVIRSFATALPIRVGDAIGIHAIGGAFIPIATVTGAIIEEFEPFADGSVSGSPETFPGDEEIEMLFNAEVVAAPTSVVSVPTCSENGNLPAVVATDPATTAKALVFRIDGGATQSAPAAGGTATVAVPPGHHTLEYWGEDAVPQQESTHHTATLQVGGCGPPAIVPTPPLPVTPQITHVSQSHASWRAGPSQPHISRKRRPPVGTTFSFELNESANVTFSFAQSINGRKVKGRCVSATKRNRRSRACKRTVSAGALRFVAHAGRNTVAFAGHLPRSRLKPGRYTLTITATDASGHAASPQTLAFTIVK